MTEDLFGFIGLGNMGRPMAQNIISRNLPLIVYDLAGTRERSPDKSIIAVSNTNGSCPKVFLLLTKNINVNIIIIYLNTIWFG